MARVTSGEGFGWVCDNTSNLIGLIFPLVVVVSWSFHILRKKYKYKKKYKYENKTNWNTNTKTDTNTNTNTNNNKETIFDWSRSIDQRKQFQSNINCIESLNSRITKCFPDRLFTTLFQTNLIRWMPTRGGV